MFKWLSNLFGSSKPNQVVQSSISGLSPAGQSFVNFMNDLRPALGTTQPRETTRSRLLQVYRDDLKDQSKGAATRFMETDHGYIQNCFPLAMPGVNSQAPVLEPEDFAILSKDESIKAKMKEHFDLFIEFMGLKYVEGKFTKVDRYQWGSWIAETHNARRITRILTSINNLGLSDLAKEFLSFLQAESKIKQIENGFAVFNDHLRNSCDNYWSKALEPIKPIVLRSTSTQPGRASLPSALHNS